MPHHHRAIAPRLPKHLDPAPSHRPTFFDLPPEIRLEIYKMALEDVTITIASEGARTTGPNEHHPLGVAWTNRQIRGEVLPLVYALCPVRCTVKDFDFRSLLGWLSAMPPGQDANLAKNHDLMIRFETGSSVPHRLDSLRKWLHLRADRHRTQPKWKYVGKTPSIAVRNDMRRRVRRMREPGKREELLNILRTIGVHLDQQV